jgi:CRISPR Csm4 C-terminal domain
LLESLTVVRLDVRATGGIGEAIGQLAEAVRTGDGDRVLDGLALFEE